jgi:hypothetical protein
MTSLVFSQELTATDLTNLKEMNLNDAETLLSQRKFDFKEVKESEDQEKYYAFSFNLDKYGEIGDEYIVISIDENDNATYVFYQLKKEGWTKLKNSLIKLGYKKIKTEAESDGSLTTKYSNSKFYFSFNAGKTQDEDNENVFVYTLSVM